MTVILPNVREYRLSLDLRMSSGAFEGRIEIDLENLDGDFPLNAHELTDLDARWPHGPAELDPRAAEEELWVLRPPRGSSTLTLSFHGQATDRGLIGLYRCRYGEASILTTQCQPTGTRRVFPCIDRPDRKAPFRFELTVDEGVDAIFNTPVESVRRHGDRVTRRFLPTPPMATYLFYFGVGRFDWVHASPQRVALSVAAPLGRASSGRFVLDHASLLLPAYESYFGIPYPLPKLDLVTVPEHAWGAMENWGAITFRDVRLLVDAGTSGRQRRDTLSTLAHEIAHQWFGNLVTMAWWNDIWLNESFATFMELLMVEKVAPGTGVLDDFLLLQTSPARLGDSLSSTHPVVAEVRHPEEIGQAFDEISYGKGASVLRMLEGYLGETSFRAGVSAYLNRFRFGNARGADLWDSLEHASGEPVGAILSAWLGRPGIPVLRAREADGHVEVRQERFSLLGRVSAPPWPVPLVYTDGGHRRSVLLRDASSPLSPTGDLFLNPEASGYYRVHYDAHLREGLLRSFPLRPAVDRWTVLEDLAAFVFSGDVTPEEYLAFVKCQEAAPEYLIVQELVGDLGWFALLSQSDDPLAREARRYLRAQWDRLGPVAREGESEADGILRGRVATALLLRDEQFAESLAERFDGREFPDGNLRGPIVAAFARTGGREAYRRLRSALASEHREAIQFEYEFAMVSSRDPTVVGETLDLTGTEVLNRAHTAQIVRRAAVNPEAKDPTWEWVRRALPEFARAFPGTDLGGYTLQHSLPFIGVGRLEEVRSFLRETPIPLAARGAEKGLALLEVADRFYRRSA